MARRTIKTNKSDRQDLSIDEKRQGILRLTRRIEELDAFDPNTLVRRFNNPDIRALETAIATTLTAIFGDQTPEYRRYASATRLDHGPITMGGSWGRGHHDEAAEARRYLSEGKAQSLALLRQAIRTLEEEIEFADAQPEAAVEPIYQAMPEVSRSRKVFVVHGHDEGARERVARFLEKIGFEPVILHEQANRGRTVIEKIEAHGDVDFAVVLLTPDDEGRALGEELEPRARQNVLLELGYFIGRLGRAKVCALKRGEVEIPSDFAGVVWQSMNSGADWMLALGRELQDAGHAVDWNKIVGQ
jgi:predicted nucleotide-binding protein